MKYMGSKARVANDISSIINKLISENGITTYIEPFVGGSNMIEHIQCENKFGYDNNEYLVEFWKQIQKGWNPLPIDDEDADMTKELYQDIKDHKEKYPKHIVALAGFCATYNAKWFGGYAGIVKTKIGTFRNYYYEAVRNVLNQAEHIKDVHYECIDYKNIDVQGALIYCDPPYQGTTKYKDDFDHEAYWQWVRKMSKKNIVLCSEYDAPDDFECIWSKELTTTLDKNSRSKAVEKLFKIRDKPQIKKLKVLELFAGTRSIGKAFEAKGHEVFSVEWDKDFENINLYADISKVTSEEIIEKFGKPDVIWASPDCATFSIAAISHHRRKNEYTGNLDPVSDYAKFCDEVDQHVLKLIEELNPTFYFIENPRGGMRKMTWMQGLPRYTVTYCQYELDKPASQRRMKPTDIWTNHPNPQFKPMCKNGDPCHSRAPRSATLRKLKEQGIEIEVGGTQYGMKCSKERSVIPKALCQHIVDICEKYIQEKEKKHMELKMNDYQLPEQILFNYEELKQELTEKVSMYETLVYTDDQIKEAKADKANLNKLKKVLNDERIRREKEYMQPFNDFKTKINEIIGIIDKPVAVIDKQVKAYEEKQKQEKLEKIKKFWEGTEIKLPIPLTFEQIFNPKWLNASVSMKSIQDEIDAKLEQIKNDLATLSNLPEFGFEATEVYKSTLDINKAISEGHRLSEIARKKAEHEAEQERLKKEAEFEQAMNPPMEEVAVTEDAPAEESVVSNSNAPAKQWVRFQALMTTEDALALKEFFNSRHIEFKAV